VEGDEASHGASEVAKDEGVDPINVGDEAGARPSEEAKTVPPKEKEEMDDDYRPPEAVSKNKKKGEKGAKGAKANNKKKSGKGRKGRKNNTKPKTARGAVRASAPPAAPPSGKVEAGASKAKETKNYRTRQELPLLFFLEATSAAKVAGLVADLQLLVTDVLWPVGLYLSGLDSPLAGAVIRVETFYAIAHGCITFS
jgi:hypothetical protein